MNSTSFVVDGNALSVIARRQVKKGETVVMD
jgi:hypothetical protein